jgi:hypothetical protein
MATVANWMAVAGSLALLAPVALHQLDARPLGTTCQVSDVGWRGNGPLLVVFTRAADAVVPDGKLLRVEGPRGEAVIVTRHQMNDCVGGYLISGPYPAPGSTVTGPLTW